MKSGIHNQKLLESLINLEYVAFLSSEDCQSKLEEEKLFNKENMHVFYEPTKLVSALLSVLHPETVYVFLSNGDFCGAKDQLISKLKTNRG
jgi:UDP-N-acetylmuramate-alanine ligase